MNLMINNYCNLKCNYCFAQEEMHSKKAMNITMEDFCKYLDFIKNEPENQVRLIGGEPTLHPDLDKLIDKVIEYNCFPSILIFSNFTFSPSITKMFIEKAHKIPITFLPNINHFDFLIPEHKNKILYNLDVLTANLKNMDNIGINLYSPNMDLSQWENIITKYNINRVRWSISLPNKKVDNNFNVYEYYHSFQPLLLEMANWSVKYGVYLHSDCDGVPPCCIDNDALAYLVKVDPMFLGPTFCRHAVIDIAPNLETRGCFVIGCNNEGEKKTLLDFKNYQEIEDYYDNLRQEKSGWPIRKECLSCPRYQITKNSCSCLAYRKKELIGG